MVNGTVIAGTLKNGDPLLLGPTKKTAHYDLVQVKGIHMNRVEIDEASAGQ